MKTDKQIKEIFGITDEQMRILFFEIGFAFASITANILVNNIKK